MREIKFRAWDTFHSEIIDWEQVKDCFRGIDWDTVISDYPLMQFTGLKDKNGKEIYEGDIVCPDKNNQNEKTLGSVEWHEQLALFIVRYKDGTGWQSFIKMEVIGNIYENKELLK